MRKVQVTSLKERKIKHVYVKTLTKHNFLFSLILIVCVLCSCLILKFAGNLNSYAELSAKIFNPVNPLFNENNGIIFTSGGLNKISKNNLKFITPVKSTQVEYVNGEIHYVIDVSIMIIAPENGIIKSIGILPSGEKFIEIMHSKNIFTRIENIDITGVVINQAVAKGKDIATAKVGETVRFSLFEDGIKQTNISLYKNQIVWES